MKKILIIGLFVVCLFLVGCGKYDSDDVLKDLSKKIEKTKGYNLKGELEIFNNEDIYKYDIESSYKQDDYYRVSLKNISNNHEQIILRNEEGVYVLTPSLNKSFKFQSEWPFNNSQVYLLQPIIKDLENDKNKTFEEKGNYYIFTSSVNYPNNKKLVKQIVYIDKKLNVKEVQVLDNDDKIAIKIKFNNIDMNKGFNKDYFALNKNMSASAENDVEVTTSSIEDIIYPMYIPTNTHLSSQEKVSKENGERVILTFDGEKPFMLIEETVEKQKEMLTIPTIGEPYMLGDVIGNVAEESLSWISNNIEYYLVSDVMSVDELIDIASSISVLPVGK